MSDIVQCRGCYAMTTYAKGYSKGYAAGMKRGLHNAWPDHVPPLPRDGVLRDVFLAVRQLRDSVDAYLSVVIADEPLSQAMDRAVNRMDAAMQSVSEWLRDEMLNPSPRSLMERHPASIGNDAGSTPAEGAP